MISKVREILARIPLLVWFLVPTIVLVVVGVFIMTSVAKKNQMKANSDNLEAEEVSKEVEGTQVYKGVSREHIQSGTPGSGYNSNPPSSGPHWQGSAKNGIYDKELADEQLIHSLEHGYIWISYKSDAPDDVKNKLKEIAENDSWKIVLEPRDKNDTMIALVGWARVLNLDNLDEKRIKDFISTYRNRGPEKTPE